MKRFIGLMSLSVLLALMGRKAVQLVLLLGPPQIVSPNATGSSGPIHMKRPEELKRHARRRHRVTYMVLTTVLTLALLTVLYINFKIVFPGSNDMTTRLTIMGLFITILGLSIYSTFHLYRDDRDEEDRMKREYYSLLDELRDVSNEYCSQGDLVLVNLCHAIYEDLLQARYERFWYEKVQEARTSLNHVKDAAWRAQQSA